MEGKSNSNLPPGFRFHPTDEELIMYYLRNQLFSRPCPASIIPELNIYKFDPWQLPDKAEFGENEWYFFSPRERKYPNGVRPNRATVSGYWKATGTDKAIYSSSTYVGVKKALVFYKGKPPKGIKTNWIMHEYRLNQSRKQSKGSMRLDDWVLCRIYKRKLSKVLESHKLVEEMPQPHSHEQLKFPWTSSLSHLSEMDIMAPISHFLNDNAGATQTFEFQNVNSLPPNYHSENFRQLNQDSEFINHPAVSYANPILYDDIFQ